MDGIICIYKEKDVTSFDVVAKVRKIFGTKKAGHGGTLDPMAEGVLPVFLGSATKAVDFCPDNTKQYLAGFRFGLTTDTQDITGNVLTTDPRYVSRNKMILIERWFKGEMMQTPPMYSAVKVDGQRLYDLARQGREVERKPRPITVYDLKIQRYEDNEGEMLVTCSKGTYIRTLIHDIGEKMETGAVMTSLVRTRSGVFKLENCYKLGDLVGRSPEELEKLLMPLEKLYGTMPKARLDEEQTRLFRNGAVLDADRVRFDTIQDKGYYIEGSDGAFLGLGKIGAGHRLEVLRRFNTGDRELTDKPRADARSAKPVGSSPQDTEIQQKDIQDIQQEDMQDSQQEDIQDIQTEDTQDVQAEEAQDIQTEDTENIQTEDTRDVQQEDAELSESQESTELGESSTDQEQT